MHPKETVLYIETKWSTFIVASVEMSFQRGTCTYLLTTSEVKTRSDTATPFGCPFGKFVNDHRIRLYRSTGIPAKTLPHLQISCVLEQKITPLPSSFNGWEPENPWVFVFQKWNLVLQGRAPIFRFLVDFSRALHPSRSPHLGIFENPGAWTKVQLPRWFKKATAMLRVRFKLHSAPLIQISSPPP